MSSAIKNSCKQERKGWVVKYTRRKTEKQETTSESFGVTHSLGVYTVDWRYALIYFRVSCVFCKSFWFSSFTDIPTPRVRLQSRFEFSSL